MTISTVPFAKPFRVPCVSRLALNRDKDATFTAKSAKRSLKTCVCCSTKSVVGANTATCLPPETATNAARKATSVLPKPTSPQINLSIGLSVIKSRIVAIIAAAWSSVSAYSKPSANALYSSSSKLNECPCCDKRLA